MAGRPINGVNARRPKARSTNIEKEGAIDLRFGAKGRYVVTNRLARNLSTRQVQMIGWFEHDCPYTEPLLILILSQLEERSAMASSLERESRWQEVVLHSCSFPMYLSELLSFLQCCHWARWQRSYRLLDPSVPLLATLYFSCGPSCPQIFARLNGNKILWIAVLATSFTTRAVCFASSYIGARQVWSWLQSIANASNQLSWIANGIASLRFRAALEVQEKTHLLPFRN
jgi:hypothetical protein